MPPPQHPATHPYSALPTLTVTAIVSCLLFYSLGAPATQLPNKYTWSVILTYECAALA